MIKLVLDDFYDPRSRDKNIVVDYALVSTPFGCCLIAQTELGISKLFFIDQLLTVTGAEALIQPEWPDATLRHCPDQLQAIANHLFQPEIEKDYEFTLHLRGTVFQQQVWQALLTIPLGQTMTYQQVAIAIGRPTAARAVGNAVGKNPIAYLIPCHRVLRQSGEIGGYRWGRDRKQKLLAWEAEISSRSLTLQT